MPLPWETGPYAGGGADGSQDIGPQPPPTGELSLEELLALLGEDNTGPGVTSVPIGGGRWAVIDVNGNIVSTYADNTPSGGGVGGGYAGPTQLDLDMFAWKKYMDEQGLTLDQQNMALAEKLGLGGLDIDQGMFGLNQDQFDWQKAQDEFSNSMKLKEYALAVGDFGLAQQAQSDANYWQGQANSLQQAQLNLQNQGQQLDYGLGRAGLGVDLGLGQAGVELGAEQNRISAAGVAEQGNRALLDDYYNRMSDVLQGQTTQYSNETQRAQAQAQAGQANNQFLLDASTSPRDLPSMFMMQRGISPDWDTIAAGGQPARGQALAPVNTMGFFDGLQTQPDFTTLQNNPYASGVGSDIGNVDMMNSAQIQAMIDRGIATGGTLGPQPQFQPMLPGTAPSPPPNASGGMPAQPYYPDASVQTPQTTNRPGFDYGTTVPIY